MPEERLQKVLAARGIASRRAAEELIREGRVMVNGRVVAELGTKVDPELAAIKVDGRLLRHPRPTYLLLNKPRGYLTTAHDPEGRRTVFDLLDLRERVFPVGRLDMDSEGVLLLTNDGELANRIAHPRYRIDKEYHALVEGRPVERALDTLRRGGVAVDGGYTSPATVEILGPEGPHTWLKIVIHEGRKHQVRQMFAEIGHAVRRLRRVRLGPLTLAGLAPAAYRPLTAAELTRLRRMLGLEPGRPTHEQAEPPAAGEPQPAPPAPQPRAPGQPPDSGPSRETARRPAQATRREQRGAQDHGGGSRRRGAHRPGDGARPGRSRRAAPHHRD